MAVGKREGSNFDIRRGIPVALIIIFSSALFFQLLLFSFAANLIWRNYTMGVLSLLTESLDTSMKEVYRLEGKNGVSKLTRRLSDKHPGLHVRVFNDGEHITDSDSIAKVNDVDMRVLSSRNPSYFASNHKGFIFLPFEIGENRGKVYSFEIDLQSRGDLHKISIVVGVTSFLYVLCLFFFTYFVFKKKISVPLSNLLGVVKRVEEGDESARVGNIPSNELGRFGDVLNSALDLLEGRRRKLEEIVQTLKRTNEELTKSRAQVIRVEKMATIGRLSSGIAHEVGNPLMAIKGYAAHMLRNTEVNEEQRDCLERVGDETTRIEGILKSLLAHSRITIKGEEEANVNEIIDDIIRSLSYRKMCETIEIVEELSPVPKALINPEKLRQILLNIIMNGIDAMPEKGKLEVKTYKEEHVSDKGDSQKVRRRKTDPPETDFTTMRKNLVNGKVGFGAHYIVVEVSDTGDGIKEEDMDKIFDPFFTTKEPGKGTGLGLSVTSAILDSYNGYISFESQEGKGSVFRIYVPSS